jgi:hypothetical protein
MPDGNTCIHAILLQIYVLIDTTVCHITQDSLVLSNPFLFTSLVKICYIKPARKNIVFFLATNSAILQQCLSERGQI